MIIHLPPTRIDHLAEEVVGELVSGKMLVVSLFEA